MDRKFRLVYNNQIIRSGKTLYQIEALKDFDNVKKGDLGGWVESEDNLSQEGDCWIYGDASVQDNAIVRDDATIYDTVEVHGNTEISGKARLSHVVKVYDNVKISDRAWICGIDRSHCHRPIIIRNNVEIYGNASIHGQDLHIFDNAKIYGDARIDDTFYTKICGSTLIFEEACVSGRFVVCENSKICGTTCIHDYTILKNALIKSDSDYIVLIPVDNDAITIYRGNDDHNYISIGNNMLYTRNFNYDFLPAYFIPAWCGGTIEDFERFISDMKKECQNKYLPIVEFAKRLLNKEENKNGNEENN